MLPCPARSMGVGERRSPCIVQYMFYSWLWLFLRHCRRGYVNSQLSVVKKSLGHIILSLKSVLNGRDGVNDLPCFVGHNRSCTYTYIHDCNGIRITVFVLFRSTSCNRYNNSRFPLWTAGSACLLHVVVELCLSLSSSWIHLFSMDSQLHVWAREFAFGDIFFPHELYEFWVWTDGSMMSSFFTCVLFCLFDDYARGFGLYASPLESVNASSLESVDSLFESFSSDWRTLHGNF